MSFVTVECGRCGNAFSYDDDLFATKPPMGGGWLGFGRLCSTCANDDREQDRHEERLAQTERLHRDLALEREQQRALSAARYADIERSQHSSAVYGHGGSGSFPAASSSTILPTSTALLDAASTSAPKPATGVNVGLDLAAYATIGGLLPIATWAILGLGKLILITTAMIGGTILCVVLALSGLRAGFGGLLFGGLIGGFLGFKLLPDLALLANSHFSVWQAHIIDNLPMISLVSGVIVGLLRIVHQLSEGNFRMAANIPAPQRSEPRIGPQHRRDRPPQTLPIRLRWILLAIVILGCGYWYRVHWSPS